METVERACGAWLARRWLRDYDLLNRYWKRLAVTPDRVTPGPDGQIVNTDRAGMILGLP